ncbi:DUF5605 domain-containing protein [Isoptericola sp. NPDC019482]|uniref:DUF5605 domain-containing protein n=1 Tax=Isoptericola sp. NPDC019482 TaxID=3154688 RepID=UPI003478ED15
MSTARTEVEQWDVVDVSVELRSPGNPFDVRPRAEFRLDGPQDGRTRRQVEGFYDGDGVYRVRFMPEQVGRWCYRVAGPDGATLAEGAFACVPASGDNHGPVRVRDASRFRYADGTPYRPFGTTCYAWTHQPAATQERTLAALGDASFTKLRMCVFPKNYAFNAAEPARFPFERHDDGTFDLTRPDPVFYRDLEEQILALQRLGIECDLILFHPYDKGRWGFDRMDPEADERYLRYTLARLAAYRNVWWSLANEYDFMREKSMDDWDRAFATVERYDPYRHLASIHNGTRMYDPASLALYDHHRPWVTHVSLQHWDVQQMRQWRTQWSKPVVVDECGYEGDLPYRWGDLTAESVVDTFWTAVTLGGSVTHGETYLHHGDAIWWAQGGDLVGDSPARIAYLRQVVESLPDDVAPLDDDRRHSAPTLGIEGTVYLQYFGRHRPAYRIIELPDDTDFTVDVIDTWTMTSTPAPGTYRGPSRIDLPGGPGIAVLARATE